MASVSHDSHTEHQGSPCRSRRAGTEPQAAPACTPPRDRTTGRRWCDVLGGRAPSTLSITRDGRAGHRKQTSSGHAAHERTGASTSENAFSQTRFAPKHAKCFPEPAVPVPYLTPLRLPNSRISHAIGRFTSAPYVGASLNIRYTAVATAPSC